MVEAAARKLAAYAAEVAIDRERLSAEGDEAGESGIAGGFGATGRSEGGALSIADEGRTDAIDRRNSSSEAGCHSVVHACSRSCHVVGLHVILLRLSGRRAALAQPFDGGAQAGLHAAERLGELAGLGAPLDIDFGVEVAEGPAVRDF